jgi:predicted transposase YdaD
MQDFLQDSWLYQEIMQEGFDKGIEKGREEERQQRLKDQRLLLMTIIHMHFPNITNLAQKQADAIKEPGVLQGLIFKVLAAETEEEATQSLLAVSQQ